MSDFFKSYGFNPSAFGGTRQIGGFQPAPFGGQKLTPAQQELVPYISQVKQEEVAKEKKIRPVAMIFDLLQRGQYVSANLVDEFVTALSDDDPWTQDLKDLAVGFIDGLTGKRKGSFKDVLDKHTNLDEVQLWLRPDKVDESGNVLREGRNRFLGDVDLADALGLAGDIFLDPLNFIGAGAKATKAARAAAKSFADDSVKMSFKLLGLDLAQGRGDDLVKFATSNFNPATFNKLKEESLEKAVRYFNRNMGDDLARGMNNTWKKNYERALVTSPEDLRAEMGNALSRVKETTKAEEPAGIVSKMLKPFEGMGPFKAQETPLAAKALLEGPAEAVQKKATFLEDLEKNLFQSYSGAGETKAFTIFGKDIGVRSDRAQTAQRAWLAFKQKVENSGPGAVLSNAWWSVMNHGATGEIRKALGFRNPYEKFIRQTELQQGMAFYQDTVRANIQKVNKAIGDADDELMNKYVRAIDVAEAKNTAKVRASGRNITVFDVINNPELRQSLGIQDADIERLNQLAIGVGDLMKEWSREYSGYEKYMKGANVIENYLPVGRKRAYTRKGKKSAAGSQTPGFSMGRGYTRSETIAQEQAKLRWLLKDTGITPGEVKDMVEKLNIGNVEMDLPTLLYSRAQAQAEAAKRFNLMEAMKEFGLDTKKVGGKKPALATAGEMRGPIYQADRLIGDFPEVAQTATKAEDMAGNFSYADLRDALNRAGASLEELGIQSVSAKGFDGMLFDKTVAQVFKNVAMATDDKALPTLRKAVKGYMNWWKGIVTMTPGFHARNFVSNQATGFVEHGAKWFSPKHDNEALAMTIYALHKNNIDDFTKQYGVTKEWLNRTLSKEISPGRTYREAADDLVMSGLISESQMGFAARTAEDIAKSRTSINPLNRNFIGTKASRGLGSVIENQSKAKSYILNYQDIVKKLDNPKLAEEAHDFAQMEAKKWFLDYEDLTDFERNVMKNVVPFYCVPDYSEILTKEGYKIYSDLTVGEEVLTYNVEKDISEWQPIKEIAVFDFDGELLNMKGAWADFSCTKDHRWPVHTSKSIVKGKAYGDERKIVRAYDLNSTHRLIMSAPYSAKESILSQRDAAILGWIVTDGYTRWRKNHMEMVIYQSPKKYAEKVRNLLGEYVTSESIHPDTGVICFRIGREYYKKIKDIYREKSDLPRIVTHLSTEALEAMYEAMMNAEGSVGYRGTTKEFCQFVQVEGPVMDSFQIICQLLNKPFGFTSKSESNRCSGGYVRKTNRTGYKDLAVSTVNYSGKIWCPVTDNSTWYMRQNGKVIATGNTWMRKNTVNQIEGILMYPQVYAVFPKLIEAAKIDDPNFDESLIPEWMKDENLFPVGQEDGRYLMFRPDMPFMGLNLLPFTFEEGKILPQFDPRELRDDLINSLNPVIKQIASGLTEKGYDFFKKEELPERSDAPYAVQLLVSEPKTIEVLDNIIKWAGGRGLNAKVENGKIKMDARYMQLINDYFPLIKQINYALYTGTSLIPQLQTAIEQSTGIEDDYDKLEQALQVMSYWTGIKNYPLDMQEREMQRARGIYSAATERRQADMRNTPEGQARSLASREKLDETVRRMVF